MPEVTINPERRLSRLERAPQRRHPWSTAALTQRPPEARAAPARSRAETWGPATEPFVEPVTGAATPVVHRDVNPRNVMVTYSGSTKVVDFGIAKARGRLGRTATGVLKGTLHNMSPEQVNLKNVDGRSDVFSAAHVLYELLARRPLFPAVSDSELMELVSTVKAPSLRKGAQHLPSELCEVVMKGLTGVGGGRAGSGPHRRQLPPSPESSGRSSPSAQVRVVTVLAVIARPTRAAGDRSA